MGLNGSGKSTLLKLVQGVMSPDSGSVLTRGRISGLIATGAGFHPQLTGRENIYLNAAILGMSEAETNRKFEAITDFADIDDFLDSPVGYYSSGMYARLGFAIAIHVAFVREGAIIGSMSVSCRECTEKSGVGP
jgi:ABC-2 type transport system ATP-binding protein